MNRFIDRIAASPAVRRLDALPGPVWALGAYGFDRAVRGVGPLLSGLPDLFGSFASPGLRWAATGSSLAVGLASLLPLGLFFALGQRRAWALPMAAAYAGLKALVSLAASGWQLFTLRGAWSGGGLRWLSSAAVSNLLWAVAALALLLYFERSERIARLFPREERRTVAWAVVAMAVVLFATGG